MALEFFTTNGPSTPEVVRVPDAGSGHFVAEKVWSCPNHDLPEDHDCDCDQCGWELPDCCADAEWIDKTDADGNVVMRELSVWEKAFRDLPDYTTAGSKIAWLEAESLPRITGG